MKPWRLVPGLRMAMQFLLALVLPPLLFASYQWVFYETDWARGLNWVGMARDAWGVALAFSVAAGAVVLWRALRHRLRFGLIACSLYALVYLAIMAPAVMFVALVVACVNGNCL